MAAEQAGSDFAILEKADACIQCAVGEVLVYVGNVLISCVDIDVFP